MSDHGHDHETSDWDNYPVDDGRTVKADLRKGWREEDIEVKQTTVFNQQNSGSMTLRMTLREARDLYRDLGLILSNVEQGRSYEEIQAIVERKRDENTHV